jgi:hypothetical protein
MAQRSTDALRPSFVMKSCALSVSDRALPQEGSLNFCTVKSCTMEVWQG